MMRNGYNNGGLLRVSRCSAFVMNLLVLLEYTGCYLWYLMFVYNLGKCYNCTVSYGIFLRAYRDMYRGLCIGGIQVCRCIVSALMLWNGFTVLDVPKELNLVRYFEWSRLFNKSLSSQAEFIWRNKIVLTLPINFQQCNTAGPCSPFSWKARAEISSTVNVLSADDCVRSGRWNGVCKKIFTKIQGTLVICIHFVSDEEVWNQFKDVILFFQEEKESGIWWWR